MILSTHTQSRIRNLAMSAIYKIAANEACEPSDVIALLSATSSPSNSGAEAAIPPFLSATLLQPEPPRVPAAISPATQAAGDPTDGGACVPRPPPSVDPHNAPLHFSDHPAGGKNELKPLRGRKETTRSKIVSTHAAHPDWPSKLIAQHLGISEDAVRATASRKGIKLVSWWDYERTQKAKTTAALKATPAPIAPAEIEKPPAQRAEPPSSQQGRATDVLHRVKSAPSGRFYLRERVDPTAQPRYVHQSLEPCPTGPGPLMTSDRKWAWCDTMEKYRGALKKWPELAQMLKEAVSK